MLNYKDNRLMAALRTANGAARASVVVTQKVTSMKAIFDNDT